MTNSIFNISQCSLLLPSFRLLSGKSNSNMDDLYAFLTTPSPEREQFLQENTSYSVSLQNSISTLIRKPK